MDDSSISTIGFIIVVLTIYWTIRGLVQIFQRHNAILVVLYIVFLFPIIYDLITFFLIFVNKNLSFFLGSPPTIQ